MSTALEPRTVDFYGDELVAVQDDGRIYVAVKHMCDALGLNVRGQQQRISRHKILHDAYRTLTILTEPAPDGRGGGPQRTNMLRADMVPLWLSGVSVGSIKPELRDKMERYQREAASVLWEAFQSGRLTTGVNFSELLAADSPAAQAYRMAAAMMRLAEQQLLMEARLDSQEARLENIEAALGDPGRYVTPDQAMQISQAVKAIAMKVSERSGRNEYGGVYGELYRRFSIVSYKELPAARFEDAMGFLRDWHRRLTGDAPF
jgi:hypothetical protein